MNYNKKLGINKYLWDNIDNKVKKTARKQWEKGETIDCLTWNLDVFFAKIIPEYLQSYLDKASRIIEIKDDEREEIQYIIDFFNDYVEDKFDICSEGAEEQYQERSKKAFELLHERFRSLWW